MKTNNAIRLGHVLTVAGVALCATTLLHPLSAKAGSATADIGTARAAVLSTAMYAADYDGWQDTNPCRIDDAYFESMDYGCKDLRTGLIWSATKYFNGLETGWTSFTTWTSWSEFVEGTRKKPGSTYGGYSWRLPTRAEILQLSQNDWLNGSEMAHVRAHGSFQIWTSERAPSGWGKPRWTVRLGDGNVEAFSEGSMMDGIAVRR